MRTEARRHLESCKKCGNSIGSGTCDCQQFVLKGRQPLKEDVFFWRFVFSVRQFMDYQSHMAFMATCKDINSIYQNRNELWRSKSHFAFPFTIREGVGGWHRNPMIATSNYSPLTLKVINGVLFGCMKLDSRANSTPTIFLNSSQFTMPSVAQKNFNFKKLELPDNIQGNIAGAVVIVDRSQRKIQYRFVIWTEKNEMYISEPADYRGVLDIKLHIRLNESFGKIKTIKPSGIIITNAPNNNIRKLDGNILLQIDTHCVDAIQLPGDKFLILTRTGKILFCNRTITDTGSAQTSSDNDENRVEVLTDLTSRNHIIGIAFCMGQLIAWSETSVFAFGKKRHPDSTDVSIFDLLQLKSSEVQFELPCDMGQITQLKAGRDHILLLNNRGEVYSAGYNFAKQLGRCVPSTFSFFAEEDFDQKFRKVENLPDSIVALQTGDHDGRDHTSKSFFLTNTGKIYLCGNEKSASFHYSPPSDTSYDSFIGIP